MLSELLKVVIKVETYAREKGTYCPARVMARFSVHTALSEPSQTVRKRISKLIYGICQPTCQK